MSSDSPTRWKEVSDRIQLEKRELERELDRQRILDELSASRTRNYELEAALAKLARDQDRLVLVERERALKRAQIAQATALLVQEANWAKNRMENEMRLSRERLRMFPEPAATAPGGLFKPARQPSLFPASTVPTIIEPPPENQSSSTSAPNKLSASGVSQPIVPIEPVRAFAEDVVSSITDQVSEATASVVDTRAKINDAITSGYTGVMSSLMAAVQSVQEEVVSATDDLGSKNPQTTITENPPIREPPKVPTPQEVEKPSISAPPITVAPKPTGSLLSLPKATTAADSAVDFPGRKVIKREAPAKTIQQRTKGAWTDSNLQTQATIILEQLIHERDLSFQNNSSLMEQMYAIPPKMIFLKEASGVRMQREWLDAADAWLESLEPKPKKTGKGKLRIDPAIASLTGVDPEDMEEPVEALPPKPSEAPEATKVEDQEFKGPTNQVDSSDDNKKKCIIM